MLNQNYFKTTKTARYYTLGKPTKFLTNIWFVFHGYGELANEFIKNFDFLSSEETLIVAPEGLNKFYVKGFSGKVGATWMTKDNRENEIDDYVNMIDNVYKEIFESVDSKKVRMNVLGFSQGGHTAIRWLSEKRPPVNRLILWGSSFPRETDYKFNLTYWNRIKIKLLVGNKDRFITDEKLAEELTFVEEQKINYELIKYNGLHQIDTVYLQSIFNEIGKS